MGLWHRVRAPVQGAGHWERTVPGFHPGLSPVAPLGQGRRECQSVPCPVSVLRRRAVGQSLAIDDSTATPGFCRPCRGWMFLGDGTQRSRAGLSSGGPPGLVPRLSDLIIGGTEVVGRGRLGAATGRTAKAPGGALTIGSALSI